MPLCAGHWARLGEGMVSAPGLRQSHILSFLSYKREWQVSPHDAFLCDSHVMPEDVMYLIFKNRFGQCRCQETDTQRLSHLSQIKQR